jgi:hypothetical protein
MTVRDLGYRAYEGELLPASHNTWVLLRYGMWRIWGSWINKLVVFLAVLPSLALMGLAGLRFAASGREMGEVPAEAPDMVRWFLSPDPTAWIRPLTGAQILVFVAILTLRSGAGVIAEDFANKAYQFYFAKPVTDVQYLLGRVAALAVFIFAIVFVPVLFLVLVLAGLGPEDQVLERMGLVLAALVDSAIIAISCAVLSIAVSAISKSRGLTIAAWVAVLFVPLILAWLVEAITESEWMYLASLPGLLWALGDGIYKTDATWETIRWFHAGPILAILVAGGAYYALSRVRRAEVIT